MTRDVEAQIRPVRLTGWAQTRRARCWLARPADLESCVRLVEHAAQRGWSICPRGAGLSYADAALNEGGLIVDTSGLSRILALDAERGLLSVEPGVTMGAALSAALARGWALRAVPGAAGVTVAGAIASDVHGKDAARAGAFGAQVEEVDVLCADGVVRTGAAGNPDLRAAVVGGLGLFGILTRSVLRLTRVPCAEVRVRTRHVPALEAWAEAFDAARETDFVFGWLDAFARRDGLGRGVLLAATWAQHGAGLPASRPVSRLRRVLVGRRGLIWKMARPGFGRALLRLANAAMLRRGPVEKQLPAAAFFFPQEWIEGWRSLYGRRGLHEIHVFFPMATALEGLREVLHCGQRDALESRVGILKPHAPGPSHPLAFAAGGWSFTVEIPARDAGRARRFADDLFGIVAGAGGRVYLTKDALLTPGVFRRMYPRWEEVVREKRARDPEGRFASDLYRRLLAPAEG
jgi:decaprenylphospho-beta-D-ribofuranose 2-oxidase